jgi:hypothetical protein
MYQPPRQSSQLKLSLESLVGLLVRVQLRIVAWRQLEGVQIHSIEQTRLVMYSNMVGMQPSTNSDNIR